METCRSSRKSDTRLITIRRGGTLTDEHHRMLAEWALACAEHVLHLFESTQPGDGRPRDVIEVGYQRRRSPVCWDVFDD